MKLKDQIGIKYLLGKEIFSDEVIIFIKVEELSHVPWNWMYTWGSLGNKEISENDAPVATN